MASADLGENSGLESSLSKSSNKNSSNLKFEFPNNDKPMKIVEKHSNKLQKKIVKGNGISATIAAIPKH